MLLTDIVTVPKTSVGQWITLITLIVGAIGFRFDAWMKSKRESEDRQIEETRNATYRIADFGVNTEIRDAVRQVEKTQTAQNGKLAEVVAVNEAHHEELIRALPNICKADC